MSDDADDVDDDGLLRQGVMMLERASDQCQTGSPPRDQAGLSELLIINGNRLMAIDKSHCPYQQLYATILSSSLYLFTIVYSL